jgi:hypothetical protein
MRLELLMTAICSALLNALAAQVNYSPLEPAVLLPDGSSFQSWSDEMRYTRTYHVNAGHPNASDDNPGSEERPFRTINRAAQEVRPAFEAGFSSTGA